LCNIQKDFDYCFEILILIKKALNFEKSSTKNNDFGKQNKLGIFGFFKVYEFFSMKDYFFSLIRTKRIRNRR